MADLAQYPTGPDIEGYLTLITQAAHSVSPGVQLTATGSQLEEGAAEGREAFERETGRVMLPQSATQTFDTPKNGRILPLYMDLLAVSQLQIGGQTKTINTDFRLLPARAPLLRRPYQSIEFQSYYYPTSQPNTWGAIAITGSWGYWPTLPQDAWNAMVYRGLLHIAPQIVAIVSGGRVSWTDLEVSESFGQRPYGALIDEWQKLYDSAVARYKKVAVG